MPVEPCSGGIAKGEQTGAARTCDNGAENDMLRFVHRDPIVAEGRRRA